MVGSSCATRIGTWRNLYAKGVLEQRVLMNFKVVSGGSESAQLALLFPGHTVSVYRVVEEIPRSCDAVEVVR